MSRIERLFNKVNRRSSEASIDPIANTPVFLSPNTSHVNTSGSGSGSGPSGSGSLRSRAKSLSLVSSHGSHQNGLYNAKSNDSLGINKPHGRSKSVSRKQTKELIKYETQQVILKKLAALLNELGLQKPVPLKIDHSNSSSLSKNINIYIANSNNCIYLAPASSASFTYEDVENGGMPENQTNHQDLYNHINEDEEGGNNNNGVSNDSDDECAVDDTENDDPLSTSNKNNFSNESTQQQPTNENIPSELRTKLESFHSPNYLCSNIDSDTPIPHTFGVIIELNKDTAINNIKFEFASLTNILWPSGDPYNKSFTKEKFKIGKLDWIKNLNNADFYLNNLNSHDFKYRKISPEELAKRTRYYKLNEIKDLAKNKFNADNIDDDDIMSPGISRVESDEFYDCNSEDQEVYKAGIYLFLLPVLLPEHIPPTITSINGFLNHLLNVSIHKNSDKLNRKLKLLTNYNLPMVRTPPSFANSIADKPIYVNRVWNDALHYIITFPRKYVALGSEHSINVKVVPLVKDVIIKRIKFNVLERITYVSKDLSKEYDYDGEDPYYLKPFLNENKVRERVVSICELKTKNKPSSGYSEPYKEEVIKCPDNNLLFSCYEPDSNAPSRHHDDIENFRMDEPSHRARVQERARSPKHTSISKDFDANKDKDDENVMVASPLDINIALPFLTTRSDKLIQTSNNEEELKNLSSAASPAASRKASIMSTDNLNATSQPYPPSSPIIGALETNLSHNHSELLNNPDEEQDVLTPDSSLLIHELSHNYAKENIYHGYTTVGRALYPDSNFRHIQIYHRLQVCFRISKPDPNDNYKMHHYEVVVDTPLILLSANCNEESVQLPKYDEVNSVNHRTTSLVGSPGLSTTNPTTSVRSPSESAVSFRTPNYERDHPVQNMSHNGQVHGNGFSIKPWNESETDNLPTFEEATFPSSSPITRSFSISEDPLSRIPSISIDTGDPINSSLNLNQISPSMNPPAYEDEVDEDTNPLNIDAVVNQRSQSESGGNKSRGSKLRSSLVSSFAPTNNLVPPTSTDNVSGISPTNSIHPSNEPKIHGAHSVHSSNSANSANSPNSDSASTHNDNLLESSGSGTGSSLSESDCRNRSASQISLDSSTAINAQNVTNAAPPNFDSLDSFQSSNNSGNLPDTSSTAITTEDENHSKFNETEKTGVDDNGSLGIIGKSNGTSTGDSDIKDLSHGLENMNVKPLNEPTPTNSSTQGVNKGLDSNDLESIGSKRNEMYQGLNDSEYSLPAKDKIPSSSKSNPATKFTHLPDESESNVSINTHGSSYYQRIPLLRNTSTESTVPLAKQSTINTENKSSSDDLSIITENNQQDIYHAY